MTYASYTREELMQLALNASTVTLERDVVLQLLERIDSLQVELAEEKATVAVIFLGLRAASISVIGVLWCL